MLTFSAFLWDKKGKKREKNDRIKKATFPEDKDL